jgi:uncharacterized iron-regulated protein
MLSPVARSRRRSAPQLHAVNVLRRELAAADSCSRHKYLRDYQQAYRTYEAVLSEPQLAAGLRAADVLLVGDYHTLPASQQFAAALVEQLAQDAGRPVVLGLEMIYARDQRILDEWVAGEIDERELRERIRYESSWGYDWAPFAALLHAGRAHCAAVYGVDCMPRGDMRKIAQRDRHAAAKIAELRERHPGASVVIVFGESHLAPNHLPAELARVMPQARVVTVLQNVDELYWKAAGERRDQVAAVRVSDDVLCVFNASPLEKYESYRQYIERWRQERPATLDLAPTAYNLLDSLLRFLYVDKYAPHNGSQPKYLIDRLPEVHSRASVEAMQRVLERRAVPEARIKELTQQLAGAGCCYAAEADSLFVARYELSAVAAEIARFLYLSCRGTTIVLASPEDCFYTAVLEHGLAHFGARMLCPSLPAARESDLYPLYTQPREAIEEHTLYSYREYMQMVDFVVLHKDYEGNVRQYHSLPPLLREGVSWKEDRQRFVVERLGRIFGSELYDAYVRGRVSRRYLRALFFRKLAAPEAARNTYFEAVRRSRPPRRQTLAA